MVIPSEEPIYIYSSSRRIRYVTLDISSARIISVEKMGESLCMGRVDDTQVERDARHHLMLNEASRSKEKGRRRIEKEAMTKTFIFFSFSFHFFFNRGRFRLPHSSPYTLCDP